MKLGYKALVPGYLFMALWSCSLHSAESIHGSWDMFDFKVDPAIDFPIKALSIHFKDEGRYQADVSFLEGDDLVLKIRTGTYQVGEGEVDIFITEKEVQELYKYKIVNGHLHLERDGRIIFLERAED